jgi:hypothetical protein
MAVNITLSEPQAASPVLERGPLKDLYRAPYKGIDNLQYPRDLGSTQKNHYRKGFYKYYGKFCNRCSFRNRK